MRLIEGCDGRASFFSASISSTGSSRPITRASFAGVRPRARRTSSAREHPDVHQLPRELCIVDGHRLGGDLEIQPVRDDEAVDHVELGGCAAVHADDGAVLDHELGRSDRAARPPATRPSSGSGETSVSRWRSRCSREVKRRLRIGEEPSFGVGARQLPARSLPFARCRGSRVARPLFELGRRRSSGRSAVDGERSSSGTAASSAARSRFAASGSRPARARPGTGARASPGSRESRRRRSARLAASPASRPLAALHPASTRGRAAASPAGSRVRIEVHVFRL